MEVFQLLDTHPLLGHYRIEIALDSLGYRYGHTTVWQTVALYKEPVPAPRKRHGSRILANALSRRLSRTRSGVWMCAI